MIDFLKTYKSFGMGALITLSLGIILTYGGFIRISSNAFFETAAYFAFWSFAFGMPIHKFQYLKANKNVVWKVVGLVAFFFIAIITDSTLKIPDNPLTIIFLTSFWIAVLALVSPKFFKRYRYYIIGTYSILLTYFSYVRLSAPSFEIYVTNSKEAVLLSLIIPIPIFIFVWIYEQWRWVKSLQSEKQQAELSLLKAQINPHFFFNTLNNLYSLTVRNSDQAPGVILKLSEMMRYTIYEGEKDLVSLNDEITYLNNYIDLHKIRYKKEVNIEFIQDIEEELQAAPLLLITLLENALKHGVESIAGKAWVKMHLTSKKGTISFTVENNFEPDELKRESGIGLENLRRRLDLIYPKKHTFHITEKEGIFKAELNIVVA